MMALQILQQLGCPRRSHNNCISFWFTIFRWYSTCIYIYIIYMRNPVQIYGINYQSQALQKWSLKNRRSMTLDEVHLPTLPQRESNQESSRDWEQGLGTSWSGLDRGWSRIIRVKLNINMTKIKKKFRFSRIESIMTATGFTWASSNRLWQEEILEIVFGSGLEFWGELESMIGLGMTKPTSIQWHMWLKGPIQKLWTLPPWWF